MTIAVRYWRGTTELEGVATTYRGALRIADRNSNAHGPTFWFGSREVWDDGNGLAYEEGGERLYVI